MLNSYSLNGTNILDGNGSVQLIHHMNGKTLPNIPDLNPDLELDRNVSFKTNQNTFFAGFV